MVLLEPPAKPKRWKFREDVVANSGAASASAGPGQQMLSKFFKPTLSSAVAMQQRQRSQQSASRPCTQVANDEEREWTPPVGVILCRKGFLIPTKPPENRELVKRLIRDLTYNYPEEKHKRHGASSAEKPPLHCFCSVHGNQPEQLLLADREIQLKDDTAGIANAVATIGEMADWSHGIKQQGIGNETDNSQAVSSASVSTAPQKTTAKSAIARAHTAAREKRLRADSASYILAPKFFLIEQFKKRRDLCFDDHNVSGAAMADSLQFTPLRTLAETARRPQVSATNFAIKHLRRTGGAVLCLPVGCGKTVCGIYIAMQMRVCTLIVVGTENLIDQWYERIHEFAPGARVGRIQSTTCDTANCDFVIACTKSLSERQYPSDRLRKIGMIIFDEAHHAAAPTFLTAVWQVAAPYMLALTADPTRQDGMTDVLYNFFSYNVFVVKPSLPPGIELHVGVHHFNRRCFIQDADCVSDNKLRERRHNAQGDIATLGYCEALVSFDKRHYARASTTSALVPIAATRDEDCQHFPGGSVAPLHAKSAWQAEFAEKDVDALTYTQIYQSLQRDAHRNAVIVAYTKQFLKTRNVTDIQRPTRAQCNDISNESVHQRARSHVLVGIKNADDPSRVMQKCFNHCSRDEIQRMTQVERQVLVLASERSHIDALHDRFLRSGFTESSIAVFVGGEKFSAEKRNDLLARRVILATYAMAAEGTDIASLNTIIFATPRSSITDQAIGRALRDKLNPGIMPYVLDLCDTWCQMTKRMYWTRHRSYKFYSATITKFEDMASYEAVGAVCWKKSQSTRTQRAKEEKKRAREVAKEKRDADKKAQQAEKKAKREALAAEKRAAQAKKKEERQAVAIAKRNAKATIAEGEKLPLQQLPVAKQSGVKRKEVSDGSEDNDGVCDDIGDGEQHTAGHHAAKRLKSSE